MVDIDNGLEKITSNKIDVEVEIVNDSTMTNDEMEYNSMSDKIESTADDFNMDECNHSKTEQNVDQKSMLKQEFDSNEKLNLEFSPIMDAKNNNYIDPLNGFKSYNYSTKTMNGDLLNKNIDWK